MEKFPDNEVTEVVQRELLEQWVESCKISIPLLGINVGVSDAPVFGSIGLLIINFWFYVSIRRENHVIGFLLRDAKKEMGPRAREWVYHGIASSLLFINITRRVEPIMDLDGVYDKKKIGNVIGSAFRILVFLPSVTVLFLIISDILTIYMISASYRFPHYPLLEHIEIGDAIKVSIMDGLAFILLFLIIVLSFKILYFIKATANIMVEFSDDFKRELKNTPIKEQGENQIK